MPNLRQLTIRLASSNEELRPLLLPLMRTAAFTSNMLDSMVKDEAETLGLPNARQAKATPAVVKAGGTFLKTLSGALGAWEQARDLKGGVPGVMRQSVALMAYNAMERGTNIRDWAAFTDDPVKLVEFLRGALRRHHRDLKEAVFQAALETGS